VSALVLEGKRLRQKFDDQPAVGYRVLKQLTPFLEMRLQKTRLRILETEQPLKPLVADFRATAGG